MTTPRPRWCLLIHALPAKPLYLRARIRRLLVQSGAAPLKRSVYVVPYSEAGLERLRSIAAEIEAQGSSAFVCEATFPDAETEGLVVRAYNEERRAHYRAWMDEARHARLDRPRPARLARLRDRLQGLHAHDRFQAPGSHEAAALLADLERRHASGPPAPAGKNDLVGRRWVTRKGLHVDRLACAWVVLRFVDPSATFRFVAAAEAKRAPAEIGFDIPGAEITHDGGRCSVESLLLRAGVKDAAVRHIAEIVHDIDLQDERYRHPETVGFQQLLVGTIASCAGDEERLARGLPLFDALYAATSRRGPRSMIPAAVQVRVPPGLGKGRRS